MSGCVLATTEWGPMLIPVGDQWVGGALIADGVYSPAEFAAWVPYVSYGHTVIEVGAHCGAHTLAFARAVGPRGRVIACEMQPGLTMMLAGTMALNGQWHVEVRNAAVGASGGVLHVPRRTYVASENYGGVQAVEHEGGDAVPVVTLDMMGGQRLPRLDFLKIDVEGAEYAVLAGAKQTIARHHPVICCEADRKEDNGRVFQWLRQMGYRLWWHRPPLGPSFPGVMSQNVIATVEGQPDPKNDVAPVKDGETWPND